MTTAISLASGEHYGVSFCPRTDRAELFGWAFVSGVSGVVDISIDDGAADQPPAFALTGPGTFATALRSDAARTIQLTLRTRSGTGFRGTLHLELNPEVSRTSPY